MEWTTVRVSNNTNHSPEDLEISVIRAISEQFGRLPDPVVVNRVATWIWDRFYTRFDDTGS